MTSKKGKNIFDFFSKVRKENEKNKADDYSENASVTLHGTSPSTCVISENGKFIINILFLMKL